MARAGLRAVKKTVHGKRGSVQRTYWVKADAKPVAARRGGKFPVRTMDTVGMLKAHGLGVLGRGVGHGAIMSGGALAGLYAGHHADGRAGGMVGQHVGTILGGRIGGHVMNQTKGSKRFDADSRKMTAGALITAGVLRVGTTLATHEALLYAHNRAVRGGITKVKWDKIPFVGAHAAGKVRAEKMRKAAQQAHWNEADTAANARRGYAQGVKMHIRDSVGGKAVAGAAGRAQNAVRRAGAAVRDFVTKMRMPKPGVVSSSGNRARPNGPYGLLPAPRVRPAPRAQPYGAPPG